jgi:hypothetical protein
LLGRTPVVPIFEEDVMKKFALKAGMALKRAKRA